MGTFSEDQIGNSSQDVSYNNGAFDGTPQNASNYSYVGTEESDGQNAPANEEMVMINDDDEDEDGEDDGQKQLKEAKNDPDWIYGRRKLQNVTTNKNPMTAAGKIGLCFA